MKPYTATDYEVRAFLEGRKTQFRVPVEPQPEHKICECPYSESGFAEETQGGACRCTGKPVTPPYKPGDLIEVGSITLEVGNVRVQKLQDITFEECRSEGMDPAFEFHDPLCEEPECDGWHYGELYHFIEVWNERHPTRPWDANPFVWVFDVKVLEES